FQGRRSPGFFRVQLSEDASLRYIHSSETLTLTLNHTAEHLLEADIKLFRKYFWDRAFLIKALEEQEATSEKPDMPSSAAETEEARSTSVEPLLCAGQLLHPVLKTLFAGAVSLVNMNIRDYFLFYYSLAIKNMFMMFGCSYQWILMIIILFAEIKNSGCSGSPPRKEDVKRVKSPVVPLNEHEDPDRLDLGAGVREVGLLGDVVMELTGVIFLPGKSWYLKLWVRSSSLSAVWQVENQKMDSDSDSPFNYSWPSFPKMKIRRRASKQDRSFDALKKSKHPPFLAAGQLSDMLNGGDEIYANCMVIDQGSWNPLEFSTHSLMSISFSYASNLNLSFGLRGFEKEQSRLKKRSSSLDALDADSEGEGHSEQLHNCYTPVCQSSSRTGIISGDESGSFETNTESDFNISRTESFSLSSSLQLKESLFSGIRSRSYSCSSPKISLGKTRLIRDFTVCNSVEEQRAYSLPEPPRENRIQEEEWDKYIIPAKSESEKYKVSRTFSFLMNRMTSPRNKSKTKGKDAKDKEKLTRHQFVPGTFSGVLQCLVCDKTLLGKESFQCSNCNGNVHKVCKDAAPLCTKKFQEKYNKNKPQTILGSSSFRDVPPPGLSLHPSSSMPIGLPTGRKEMAGQVHPLSRSVPGTTVESSRRPGASLESENDGSTWRSRSHSDEMLQPMGSSPSTDSFLTEDVVDSSLWSDLSGDAQEFEAESWSLVVDPSFCSQQEKDVIQRQDVIFELMQTEMHHIQTLLIMSEIFRKGMKEELQLDHSTVDKIFPCLDELLEIHKHFFYSMKERRQESCVGNDRNFIINRIGDILVQQLRNSNLLARRRGIPECILLVTQRITKYPVLVERILQYTKESTEEQRDLCKALCLIKDMIAAVDLKVSEYEKKQKWLEILNKIENKTYTKLKNGHVFRKQALMSKERTLLYDGLVYWKTATGRFKDILALLLTDVLLFLQEKDQKYIFAAVDQKPSVISLQKLIAREVANEERGMFLISASSAGPEMYEIHTNSKEERNTWMRRIQQAVESCPEEEGGRTSESDEERRKAEARVAKIQQCQDFLGGEEPLQELLWLQSTGSRAQQAQGSWRVDLVAPWHVGSSWTRDRTRVSCIAESLQVAVTASQMSDACQPPEEGCGEPALPDVLNSQDAPGLSTACARAWAPGALSGGCRPAECCPLRCLWVWFLLPASGNYDFPNLKIIQAIQNLTRLLYSLQAALTIQDSHIEIHRLVLQQRESLAPGPAFRGSPFQDQKSRSLEKQQEELADTHKLQLQFQQDQHRWLRRCDQQQREQEARASRLQERERECWAQEELLLRSRGELDQQLQDYQQSLERLREGQRLVERERERMRAQQSLLHHWKHGRQSSLPAAFSPGTLEVMELNQSETLCHENSFFFNEALVEMSLNPLNKPTPPDIHQDAAHPPGVSHSGLVRTSENQVDLKTDVSQPSDINHELWIAAGACHQIPPLHQSSKDSCKNDLNISQTAYPLLHDSNPRGPQLQTFMAEEKLNLQRVTRQDGETGNGAEENIVYL
ncbi:hypothetical protein MG293_014016, partial [Ovis ammon polii]